MFLFILHRILWTKLEAQNWAANIYMHQNVIMNSSGRFFFCLLSDAKFRTDTFPQGLHLYVNEYALTCQIPVLIH